MDSDWNSSSFSPGTLDCLLCKDTLQYKNGDRTEFIDHLKNVHQTKFHHNLILAITFFDNDNLNDIVSQFEKTSNALNSDEKNKSVGKQIAEVFGIEDENKGLLFENEATSPNKSFDLIDTEAIKVEKKIHQCESCEKSFTSRAALNMHTRKNHTNSSAKRKLEAMSDDLPASKKIKTEAHRQAVESTEISIDYEYIVSCSEYFKKNPKQITTKCNIALHSQDIFPQVDPLFPTGWKLREHTKSDGTLEKHFLAPDGRVLKSRRAAMEYMSILGKYTAEEINKVKDNNKTIQKKKNSIESSIENIKAIQKQNVEREAERESVIKEGITVQTDLMGVKKEPTDTPKFAKVKKSLKRGSNDFAKSIKTFGDLWKHLSPVDDEDGEDGSRTWKKNKFEKKRKSMKGTKLPGMPKKPTTSFFIFMQEEGRERAKKENPSATVQEIAKLVGEMWAKIEDKTIWEEKNKAAKEKYEEEYKEWFENGGEEALKKANSDQEETQRQNTGTLVQAKYTKKSTKRKSNERSGEMKPSRQSGVGVECPECHKVVGALKRHLEDMHSPPGHFPCPGCKKVFTSRNKQSSHTSRNCNPNNPNARRKSLISERML